jgi:hypothetical protein
MSVTIEYIISFIENYRNIHNITYSGVLQTEDYIQFVKFLQTEISKMHYTVKSGTELIPYSGTYAEVPAWKIVQARIIFT